MAPPGAAGNGLLTSERQTEMLRFATAGSVDDGKSTLIGRLLYDTKELFEDQLEAVERTSAQRGDSYVDLALLTDGLRAEREQGITIDVAYRYFATPRRKFVIADTPGHIQYTRNMVTGASTADLSIVLIDARKGVVEQSRRHAFLSSLLRIPHLVVAVNKMDLVDYDEAVYERIAEDFSSWASKLEATDITFTPISALHGDNLVERSANMPWYQGPSLLYHLEHVHIASDRNLIDNRFPRAVGGAPDGRRAPRLPRLRGPGRERGVQAGGRGGRAAVGEGDAGQAHRHLRRPGRGGLLPAVGDHAARGRCRHLARRLHLPPSQPAGEAREFEAMVCWMTDHPLREGARYAIKHTSRTARAVVDEVRYRLDVNTLHRDEEAGGLDLNEIGRLRLRTSAPLHLDEYRRNRATGGFILIDEGTNDTVGAGMVLGTEG